MVLIESHLRRGQSKGRWLHRQVILQRIKLCLLGRVPLLLDEVAGLHLPDGRNHLVRCFHPPHAVVVLKPLDAKLPELLAHGFLEAAAEVVPVHTGQPVQWDACSTSRHQLHGLEELYGVGRGCIEALDEVWMLCPQHHGIRGRAIFDPEVLPDELVPPLSIVGATVTCKASKRYQTLACQFSPELGDLLLLVPRHCCAHNG
mmetsp:Transcript_128708/g.181559  ORF Transcript_128708/g.181559 Transcript_128708/m.181559 type:complete len:202 (+) Transcript_128708:138-743(+)